jgi:hypothetical protein
MSTQSRLKACMKNGRMTVADLALWFDRSYPTVRNWVQFGTAPHGPRNEKFLAELELLEKLIRKREGVPVPFEVNHFERPAYIEKLRHEQNSRLPRFDTAR